MTHNLLEFALLYSIKSLINGVKTAFNRSFSVSVFKPGKSSNFGYLE